MKTALFSLGKDGLHSSSFAVVFGSISRIIYGWGKLVPLVTYTKYFKRYRDLVDTKFQELLFSVHSSECILGVNCDLFLGWKRMKLEGRKAEFEEYFCKLFGILRDVWADLCGLNVLVFKEINLEPRKIDKWRTRIHSCLFYIHWFMNPIMKDAWVSIVCKLSRNWKHVETYRKTFIMTLGEHVKNRDGFLLQNCENLAISVGLDTKNNRRKWHDEEKFMDEVFFVDAVSNSLPKNTEKKVQKMTRIGEKFKPKSTAGSSSSTISESGTMTKTKKHSPSIPIMKLTGTGIRSTPQKVKKWGFHEHRWWNRFW